LALCSQTSAQSGTPDCPVVHRTVSDAPGWSPVKVLLSEIDGGVRLKITGLSGEPTIANANGRPRNLRATRGLLQRSAGAPDSVWCANQPRGATVEYAKFGRRSCTGQSIGPVRCATRQKARMAFQVCLQRLLAALGLQKGPSRRMEE
jgi:hypothetical protein